jgi:large subunit ribosomal protein L23
MSVIKHPNVTEKAMDEMDFQNKLEFVCDPDASKPDISEAVETQFGVEVVSVNTQVRPSGDKKAIVRLSEDDDAQEVASRIGVF